MNVRDIRAGDDVLDIGPATSITYPLAVDGEPCVVRIEGDEYVLTVPANCDIPVVRGDEDDS